MALAVALVLLLNGFLAGMYRQITSYIDHTPAAFFVGQDGVANFQGATSLIPTGVEERVRGVPGVSAAKPLFAQYAVLELHGSKVTAFLLGYDPEKGGGPWRLSAGRQVHERDEVVLDRVLARRHDLRVGDLLWILGKRFTISGLSEGTTSWMLSLIFVHQDAARSLLRVGDSTSYVLAEVGPEVTADPDRLAEVEDRLRTALPGLTVLPRKVVAANDVEYLGSIMGRPVRLMVFISFGIGALLAGLTIYSATVERMREYGVMKAIGMRNRTLYGVVIQQALGSTAAGYAAGVILVFGVATAIEQIWPQFLISITAASLSMAAGGALVMALLAALLPVRYVAAIDPARVFRR